MSDTAEAAPEKKKKGGKGKLMMIGGALIVLIGGGVGAGLYASSSGLIGGGHGAARPSGPRLVPASEQKGAPAGEGGEGEGGGHGTTGPSGEGGDKYASNYYTMEKEFTSNLKESVHFIQVGIAVSTPYDDSVINNLKTHEIAVRSAILMELGNTDEETVFTEAGKVGIQKRVAAAINRVLKQKTGFGGIGNVYFTNFVVQ